MVGEISNFNNHYRTGHMYFTLKDENSAIKAVMFKSNAQRLRFMPEDGMSVIVRGRVSLFEAAGAYQIYIDDMQPDGVGALTLQLEQVKRKLRGVYSTLLTKRACRHSPKKSELLPLRQVRRFKILKIYFQGVFRVPRRFYIRYPFKAKTQKISLLRR